MGLILTAVTILVVVYVVHKWLQWRHLPPGPWGLPVLGYLPFLDRQQPHQTLTDLARKYGPVYSVSMGSVLTVVVSDHALVREALAKEELTGRAPLYLTHGIMEGNGIICAEGALWKDQRKLVSTWLKNYSRSSTRQEVDTKVATGVTQLLEEIITNGSDSMDLAGMVTNILGNVVNDLVFGYKFPPRDPTWQWLRQVQEEGCHEMSVAGVVNFLPFIRFFSKSVEKTMTFIRQGQRQSHKVYATMVARRRNILGFAPPKGSEYGLSPSLQNVELDGLVKCVRYSKKSPSTEVHYFDPEVLKVSEGECILDNFLREQKKRFENKDETAAYTSDKQLLYLLADLFGAGLDTTSVTLSWFLLFMALYQDEQELVRQELLETVADDDSPVDASRLPRLMAALCEAQRLRSIVPVGIPHGCVKACELGGYRIPRGAMVVPLQWAVHTDPAAWSEPHEFRPSRFLGAAGELLKPPQFIPFQTGRRACPGDELSRTLAAGVMARLLRRVRVRTATPPSADDLRGHVGVTLGPGKIFYYCECIN